ncbi:C2H2-type zinc finger transcription factor [Phycomyces blakesleeanus]|uniref:C2H2-type zinc finger transcription factor n=2 Tax=Phycomyces blakesleeanus TaxID=4837 RepID=A0A163BGU8_PHYB8|nr:C2H2-type zinc finger transcription factor [Phycomyces blakesleeanus NRRL 1555(-)]OAD81501.1 C2H2-type zinc finger transcription factor [Phycomyces blakesleeanus NRRL 1555(-)]|eukprot:XP_018299541.1 C2H2-type zinc finger transcription factor [Phycomyces blakesleeanus NRRL 1555(-)]
MSLNSGLPTGRYERVEPSSRRIFMAHHRCHRLLQLPQDLLKATMKVLSNEYGLFQDYDHHPETLQQQVQYNLTSVVIRQYDPRNPLSQNTRASSPSSTNMHRCPECPYETDKKSNFDRHTKTHSGDRRLFCCPKCPKKYTKNYNLKRHINQRNC